MRSGFIWHRVEKWIRTFGLHLSALTVFVDRETPMLERTAMPQEVKQQTRHTSGMSARRVAVEVWLGYKEETSQQALEHMKFW